MKWLIRILIVLVLLIGGLLWFGYSQIDNIIKMAVEKGGSEVLKVPVKLASVSMSPFSGSGSIQGLEIGNPAGFSASVAVRISEAELVINTESVSSDKVVIKLIKFVEPEINLEAGASGTNLSQIATNAQMADSRAATRETTAPARAESKSVGQPVKLQVDELIISSAKLNASIGGLPEASTKVTLPEIRLGALGVGPEGITPTELTAQILTRLTEEATKAGAGGALKDILKGGSIKIDADGLKEGVKDLKKLFGK